MRGQMARNRLLLGATGVKILRDQDDKLGATKTFLKTGDWGDVVRDFNSISPTDVTSKFKVGTGCRFTKLS